jgi:hypothetical protein
VALQFPDLFDEVAILERLAYKNKSQHRASKHYQSVCQVSYLPVWCCRMHLFYLQRGPAPTCAEIWSPAGLTCCGFPLRQPVSGHQCFQPVITLAAAVVVQVLKVLQLFQHLQLPAHLQALHTAAERTALPEAPAASAGSAKRARQQQPQQSTAAAQRQAVRLPSFQAGCFVLRRLLSGVLLLLDLHPAVLAAAQHLSGQLSRGYHMPFCLVAAAAASRIRVLATTALLELLQAYNGLVQLLPLLPAVAAAERGSNGVLSVSSDGLPQMLQLAWNGPVPALRSIPFEPQGPQSLQGLAAELQQTFSISSRSNGAAGLQAALRPDALQQQGAQHYLGAAGACVLQGGSDAAGDVGVVISREAFLQQLGHQQQQGTPEKGWQRAHRQMRSRSRQQQQQQQQQQVGAPTGAISFFEDKQPQPGAAAAARPDTHMQQAAAAVPLYTTVPGPGCSLGQQQHNPGPTVPVLLGLAPPANASANQAGPQHAGGLQTPAAAGSAGTQAMEIDSLPAADQEEFAQLYGQQLMSMQEQAQQQQQQGRPVSLQGNTVGQPAVEAAHAGAAVRRGFQAPAAFLAMQGGNSSDDEDMQSAPVPAAAAAASANPAAQEGLPVLWLDSQPTGSEWPAGQQQQATLGAPVHAAAAAAPTATQAQQQAAEASAAGLAASAAAATSSQAAQGVPMLQAARKGKQKKQGKQHKTDSKPEADAEPAPRDNILDMLLQGL